MDDARQVRTSEKIEDPSWGYEGHRRRQTRLGLGLSPAERLRWLEESMEELRTLVGRARADKAEDIRENAAKTEKAVPISDYPDNKDLR
jgi:hypothetical protein